MSRIDEVIALKKTKRKKLEMLGVNVHPYSFAKKHRIGFALKHLGEEIQTAGRVTAYRTHGKVVFLDIKDPTGQIQIMARKDAIGQKQFEILKLTDPGDFIGVGGVVDKTKTGEISIIAAGITFLGKALRPVPTSWNAAKNKETRFRKRYLDMLVSNKVFNLLQARWTIVKEIRRFLQDNEGFTEVETPILQAIYGGTNAKPFTTYMNALDSQFYLRVAPELYLKRLIIGGHERIFEIARNFRNEGIDQTHQPEFTMIEWYEAYADYKRMMQVAEKLIKHLMIKLHGHTTLKIDNQEINVGKSWRQITMIDAVKEHLDLDFAQTDDKTLRQMLTKNQIELTGEFTRGKALFALFDKLVSHKLIKPTWVIDYPRDISPLAKKHRKIDWLAERFEGYVGGKEIADGWSEVVDPVDQRRLFEVEQKRMKSGDDEAHPMDEDFIEALEYGMPPLGGIGVGIDRLVMFLTNTWSIKEVIAFPTLKPLTENQPPINTSQLKKQKLSQKQALSSKSQLHPRERAEKLLDKYVKNPALKHHMRMVAEAMAAYAEKLQQDAELWYQTGLLHDLDWEAYPDEHPNRAVNEILVDYPQALKQAILAHAPSRTGKNPETDIERYLFACDELSGFLHAYALMRPNGFVGMKAAKVKKKLKDKTFAANVNRDDIKQGFELIHVDPATHIQFLINTFQTKEL